MESQLYKIHIINELTNVLNQLNFCPSIMPHLFDTCFSQGLERTCPPRHKEDATKRCNWHQGMYFSMWPHKSPCWTPEQRPQLLEKPANHIMSSATHGCPSLHQQVTYSSVFCFGETECVYMMKTIIQYSHAIISGWKRVSTLTYVFCNYSQKHGLKP